MWIAFLKPLDKMQLLLAVELPVRAASPGTGSAPAENATGPSGDALMPGSKPSAGTKEFSYTRLLLGI